MCVVLTMQKRNDRWHIEKVPFPHFYFIWILSKTSQNLFVVPHNLSLKSISCVQSTQFIFIDKTKWNISNRENEIKKWRTDRDKLTWTWQIWGFEWTFFLLHDKERFWIVFHSHWALILSAICHLLIFRYMNSGKWGFGGLFERLWAGSWLKSWSFFSFLGNLRRFS